ncbi:hypothetical protein GE061_016575 [Apolygus lucorum]|uniref:Leucine-rich repeat-containing protein 34 n=1 Tax=Apolygus lucorum TaxID=248454 RepID=A0A8S9XKM2_APOLU|nr:hypothetical protein GE061_016575 [Apolygus lucorum]
MYSYIVDLMMSSSTMMADESHAVLDETQQGDLLDSYFGSTSDANIRNNSPKCKYVQRESQASKHAPIDLGPAGIKLIRVKTIRKYLVFNFYQPLVHIDLQETKKLPMDWQCNFEGVYTSPESSVSALNANWYKEDQYPSSKGLLEREHSSVPAETFSFEGWDLMEGEEEYLPRQFLPQGLDWDYQFAEMDYGTDVIVVSESEQSFDIEGGPSAVSKGNVSRLMTSNTVSSTYSTVPTGREVRPKTIDEVKPKLSPEKREGDKKKKVIVETTKIDMESDSFLQAMSEIRDRAKSMTQKQLQMWNVRRKMNDEMRKNASQRSSQEVSWDADDSEAHDLMRRATLQGFTLAGIRRSTDHQEGKLKELRRVTRELGTLDLRQHIVLSEKDMAGFCYLNHNDTRSLVLQGREVRNKCGRRVEDFDLPYIFTFLVANPNIIYLDLSYNNLTNTGAWYIMDFLSWNSSILGLNLMNNNIDALDSHMIDALCENTTLKSLRLNGNPLGKKGGEYLAFLLMFNQLEHLDLGQTDQTVESLAWISQALMQSSTLKVLDLSRVLGYQGYVSDTLHFAIAFSDILRFCESLQELHLGKNSLTDTDLEQLLFGLSFNKHLELLDLACNRIGDQGAEIIADALHYGSPLKAIVLNTNRIGDLGARALSLKLPMSQIKLLDLAGNRIKNQGIIDIVHTVRKPYPLLALFIFGNKITEPALDVIQLLILRGDLNPESLDVTIFYIEGAIGHGHNTAADRYRPRYYKIPTNSRTERFGQKVTQYIPCRPGCLDYKFYNVVNVHSHLASHKSITSNAMGPSCPV